MFQILNFSFGLYVVLCSLCAFLLAMLLPPKPVGTAKATSLDNIYFLKILLTYGIVLHHIFIYLGIWNKADICVEFFFIISGFMLLYSYSPQMTVYQFASKRIIHFTPYIFFANILSLFGKGTIDIVRLLAGVFLFSTTVLYPHHTYYMPSWYLIVLFWVGLIYFVIICRFRCYLYIIGTITGIALVALYHQSSPIEYLNPILSCLTNGMVRGLAYMGIGCFIAFCYIKYKDYKVKHRGFMTVFELLLLIYIPLAMFCHQYDVTKAIMVIEFIILLGLFLFQCGYISQILECSIWKNLACFTLPIFMTHDVVIPVMIYGSDFLVTFSAATKVLILLLLSTLFGIATYYMFYLAKLCHQRIVKIFLLTSKNFFKYLLTLR